MSTTISELNISRKMSYHSYSNYPLSSSTSPLKCPLTNKPPLALSPKLFPRNKFFPPKFITPYTQ